MRRSSLLHASALALVAAAWLPFPAVGRGQAPPTDADPATLVRELGDPAERVRFQAMAELMRIGRPATRELAQALLDVEPVASGYRSERKLSRSDLAFAVLPRFPEVDLDALLDAYQSAPPEPSTWSVSAPPRLRIRMALGKMSPHLTGRVYESFQAGDPWLRITLAGVIGRAGREAVGAVDILAHAVVEDRHAEVRAAAADALARIPEGGPQALRSLLGHSDPLVRATALAAYPADAGDSAALVARSMKDAVREVRQVALVRILVPTPPSKLDLVDYNPFSPCPHFRDEQPPPELSAGLPSSVLPDIVTFFQDGDEQTRWVAVCALGSLARARRDLAPAISEALATRTLDPDQKIAAAALDGLAALVKLKVVPRSPESLAALLGGLADPARAGQGGILALLERMDLPEAQRNEVVDALVTACLNESFWGPGSDCERARSILGARPGWREAAVEALVTRYFDVRLHGERAWSALDELGLGGFVSTKLLKRLLHYPEMQFQAGAAAALAERGHAPDRLWNLLMEGVRSFRGDAPGWESDAVQALIHLGEPGVTRLIAIVRDPATPWRARQALIHDALSQVADESPQAADFLLATAASAADPEAQAVAVEALTSIKSHPENVKAALERAFANGDAKARAAVVMAWMETGQAPGDLVTLAMADPAPTVRQRVFALLALLPQDDPRRLTLATAALRDKDYFVRNEAFRFAGDLGEPGAALLAQYVASREPLADGFFDGVERLGAMRDTLQRALEDRAADAPPWEWARIISILGRTGSEAPKERERLYARLEAENPADRESAAEALLTLREDPWAHDGRLAAALMDAGIHRIIQAALFRLYPPDGASGADMLKSVPRITWPPPPGYRPLLVVPHELFGVAKRTTLGDVYRQLASTLVSVSHGFEHGAFLGPPGGFALVARMERIQPDGTPFPEPARWIEEGSPKLSLIDLLADLFFENPGYFRVIVFAVTSDLAPGHNPHAVLVKPVDGAPTLSGDIAGQPFEGKEVMALVYSFERRHDAKVVPWEDGAPSARQHLEKAGVWARLGASARR